MAKLTQCARVLRHLEDYGSITSMEAVNEYGIMRLASRINDLKAQGQVRTDMESRQATPYIG